MYVLPAPGRTWREMQVLEVPNFLLKRAAEELECVAREGAFSLQQEPGLYGPL